MKIQHPLKGIIYAMVDDTPVQLRRYGTSEWLDWEAGSVTPFSNSAISFDWRIKPEPKPELKPDLNFYYHMGKETHLLTFPTVPYSMNLKLTFDGETGKLKAAEVL